MKVATRIFWAIFSIGSMGGLCFEALSGECSQQAYYREIKNFQSQQNQINLGSGTLGDLAKERDSLVAQRLLIAGIENMFEHYINSLEELRNNEALTGLDQAANQLGKIEQTLFQVEKHRTAFTQLGATQGLLELFKDKHSSLITTPSPTAQELWETIKTECESDAGYHASCTNSVFTSTPNEQVQKTITGLLGILIRDPSIVQGDKNYAEMIDAVLVGNQEDLQALEAYSKKAHDFLVCLHLKRGGRQSCYAYLPERGPTDRVVSYLEASPVEGLDVNYLQDSPAEGPERLQLFYAPRGESHAARGLQDKLTLSPENIQDPDLRARMVQWAQTAHQGSSSSFQEVFQKGAMGELMKRACPNSGDIISPNGSPSRDVLLFCFARIRQNGSNWDLFTDLSSAKEQVEAELSSNTQKMRAIMNGNEYVGLQRAKFEMWEEVHSHCRGLGPRNCSLLAGSDIPLPGLEAFIQDPGGMMIDVSPPSSSPSLSAIVGGDESLLACMGRTPDGQRMIDVSEYCRQKVGQELQGQIMESNTSYERNMARIRNYNRGPYGDWQRKPHTAVFWANAFADSTPQIMGLMETYWTGHSYTQDLAFQVGMHNINVDMANLHQDMYLQQLLLSSWGTESLSTFPGPWNI